ncbi:hypothetical protein GCM10010478_31110 [Streptomyces erythrogriseus]|uniref:Uncharacterized protein n=3 Tax=Streptomyces TaxID=1883 RepID=A0ABN3WXB2_9ACTN|nr:hypothetical protein GCM10010265_16750 [Streptomyces griseoincarnatus]GGT39145.1 hypothetical protein GCM10010287_09870 [Streptomyces variabilis]
MARSRNAPVDDRRLEERAPAAYHPVGTTVVPVAPVGDSGRAEPIDGRVVQIDSFPIGDDTVLITRGGNDLFSLLVVPPHTAADAARAAMAAAVRAGSQTSAEQILIDTGTERVGLGHAPQSALRHGRHEPGR